MALKSKKTARATPSKRLAAQRPGAITGTDVVARAPRVIPTKFVVVEKHDVPTIVGQSLETRYRVSLKPVYEARSIHNGLATEQGNRDNRVFGLGVPEGGIVLEFASKAVADHFVVGHAFAVPFTEIVDAS